MTDNRATNYRVGSAKHELVISSDVDTLAIGTGLDVAEITMESDSLARSNEGLTLRVPLWSSSYTALDEVTELVNVESMEAWGESGNLSLDLDGLAFDLNELNMTADT